MLRARLVQVSFSAASRKSSTGTRKSGRPTLERQCVRKEIYLPYPLLFSKDRSIFGEISVQCQNGTVRPSRQFLPRPQFSQNPYSLARDCVRKGIRPPDATEPMIRLHARPVEVSCSAVLKISKNIEYGEKVTTCPCAALLECSVSIRPLLNHDLVVVVLAEGLALLVFRGVVQELDLLALAHLVEADAGDLPPLRA